MNTEIEITDEEIMKLSMSIDDFFAKLLQDYDIHLVDISAIVVARALLVNQMAGTADEFQDVLKKVMKLNPKTVKSEYMH